MSLPDLRQKSNALRFGLLRFLFNQTTGSLNPTPKHSIFVKQTMSYERGGEKKNLLSQANNTVNVFGLKILF